LDPGSTRPPGRVDPTGPRLDPIPKPGGSLRWITRLDPAADAEYRQAVRPLAGRIERALGSEVFAIRTVPTPGGWRLAPWAPARVAWRRTLREVIDGSRCDTAFAVADVRDCYGSIAPQTIDSLLGMEAAHVVAFLRRLQERGVRGLPIGPDASAVLANAVLSEMDRAIRTTGARHLRWVDDVVLWGSRADVGRALVVLEQVADRMGLTLHEEKTRLLEGPREARAVALGDRDSSIIAAP
jgi:Reverse transcriptase (RNA-dependent DNA polymerase)